MFEDYQFEWDPQKDEANLKKHGLFFERARTIWDDERRYVIRSANRFDEERWLVVGRVGPRLYFSAVVTLRGERIRLISARESTKREIERYHHEQR